MKDRIVIGREGDVRDITAATCVDERATERIFDALDWTPNRKAEGGRIGAALRRLNASDRAFARSVLYGGTWRGSGMTKQGFNGRLKKICDFILSR